MIFCVTLWAAAKEFFNEIESDLSGGFQVVDSRDYYFSKILQFRRGKFVIETGNFFCLWSIFFF